MIMNEKGEKLINAFGDAFNNILWCGKHQKLMMLSSLITFSFHSILITIDKN
jgi:hypothetical protein